MTVFSSATPRYICGYNSKHFYRVATNEWKRYNP